MRQQTEKDFYSILGVESNCTASQIHDAYRARVKISHPDRFDRNVQPEEWKIANDMLRDLNAAYSVLRDQRSRSDYDQRRAGKYREEKPQPQPQRSTHTVEPGSKSSGTARFDTLSTELQERLVQRQETDQKHEFKFQTESLFGDFAIIGVLSCWFVYLYFAADSAKWRIGTHLWQGALSVFIGYLMSVCVLSIVQAFKSTLQSYFYVTPLYFIKTACDIVTFWPIYAIKDVAVTHNFRNGSYQNSKVVLQFESFTQTLTLPSKDKVTSLFNCMKAFDARLRKAVLENDMAYLEAHDDFAEVPRTNIPADTSSKRVWWSVYASTTAVCAFLYLIAVGLNSSYAAQKWVQHPTPPVVKGRTAVPENADKRLQSVHVKPSHPTQPLPPNGDLKLFSSSVRVAPFEIKTQSGSNYLIKLVNARTEAPVLTVFVIGGNTVTTDVPLGNYEVRYTWGDSWYGYTYLFGDSGNYSKADETFDFKEVGNQVSGYTITLYPVERGNLKTKRIEPAAF